MTKYFLTAFLFFCFSFFPAFAQNNCNLNKESFNKLIKDVVDSNGKSVEKLNSCLKSDSQFIFQAAITKPPALSYADNSLRNNRSFLLRLIKVNPEILRYASLELRADPIFMGKAIYIDSDILKYANQELLDNKLFMTKMINIDSKNYSHASYRIKNMKDVTKLALQDNGLLIKDAPLEIKGDKEMAIIAVKSNVDAFDYINNELKLELLKDKETRMVLSKKPDILDEEKMVKFLRKNYLEKTPENYIKIVNKAQFFPENKLIDRKYIAKWQRILLIENYRLFRNYQVIGADNRNYPNYWKDDLKEYPQLIKEIEKFFKQRRVDQNTVESLSLKYQWIVSKNPLTIAFKLYLLRDSKDAELSSEFADVTSLTAIAQRNRKDEWNLSIVDAMFSKEIKMDIAFENNHKQYELWDLYREKGDKTPKLIFKVEDRFRNYFEIYGKQETNNKYGSIFTFKFANDKEEDI